MDKKRATDKSIKKVPEVDIDLFCKLVCCLNDMATKIMKSGEIPESFKQPMVVDYCQRISDSIFNDPIERLSAQLRFNALNRKIVDDYSKKIGQSHNDASDSNSKKNYKSSIHLSTNFDPDTVKAAAIAELQSKEGRFDPAALQDTIFAMNCLSADESTNH